MKIIKSNALKSHELAVKVCVDEAAKVFDYQTVHQQIVQMAAAGFFTVRIEPKTALELRYTKIAQATAARLEKDGYKLNWETINYALTNKNNPTGCTVPVSSLVITW